MTRIDVTSGWAVVLAAWVSVAAIGAGCGTVETDRGAASDDADDATGDDDDDGAPGDDDDDGGGPEPVSPEIVFVSNFDGPYELLGTVTLPEGTPAGSGARLEFGFPTPFGISFQQSAEVETNLAGEVRFRVLDVDNGNFVIGLAVDTGDGGVFNQPNGIYNETGDLRGYYNGTTASPVMNAGDAPLVQVAGSNLADLDFGVGAVP